MLGAAALLAAPLAFTFGIFLMEVLELGLAAYNPLMMLTAALLLVAGAYRLMQRQQDKSTEGSPGEKGKVE